MYIIAFMVKSTKLDLYVKNIKLNFYIAFYGEKTIGV